ncbi:MAG: DUF5611 family protein [Methanomassiliicoccaceae archaeon]|jgi:hypothetical protein|nr:DUF5611 family protein [Methanomassiliicoccaceae archaeon]
MKEFDIKKGWAKNIEGDLLEKLMKEMFGNCAKDGDMLVSSYGVLKKISVRQISNVLLAVDTEAGDAKDDSQILDSKRKLNMFMEKATGFDAKARMKREQQKAKKGEF